MGMFDTTGKDSGKERKPNTLIKLERIKKTLFSQELDRDFPVSGKVLKTKISHHGIETFKLLPENKQ